MRCPKWIKKAKKENMNWMEFHYEPEKSPPSKKGMMWGLVYEKTNPLFIK